jgi:hypothetical protein
MLVGLFLVVKYLGKEWINWIMSHYFGLAGLYSVPHVISLFFLSHGFSSFLIMPSFSSPSSAWQKSHWAVDVGTEAPIHV